MNDAELSRLMHAHDSEAPSAADFDPMIQRHGRLPAVLGATVAIAAAVVAVTIGVARTPQTPAGTNSQTPPPLTAAALRCPYEYGVAAAQTGRVPSAPRGFDGSQRLVPDETPQRVLICDYGPKSATLVGARSLRAHVSGIRMNTWIPPVSPRVTYACDLPLRLPLPSTYLIGLDYGNGTEWVTAPAGECSGSTNGQFRTWVNLRSQAEVAFRTGVWPATATKLGRVGQQNVVVPGRPATLTIAAWVETAHGADHHPRKRTLTSGWDALQSALNDAPATPSTESCSHSPRPGAHLYQLTFGYAEGPPVTVRLTEGCYPEVDNGNLQIDDGTRFFPLIEQLLR